MRFLPLLAASVLVTSAAHAERPLPYDDSRPVPGGFHVEERPRAAMAITGGALAATGVSFLVYGMVERAAERRDHEARVAADPLHEGSNGISGGTVMMYAGGMMAAVGLPLLLVGITSKKSVLVRDDVAVAPVVSPSFGGLALSATF